MGEGTVNWRGSVKDQKGRTLALDLSVTEGVWSGSAYFEEGTTFDPVEAVGSLLNTSVGDLLVISVHPSSKDAGNPPAMLVQGSSPPRGELAEMWDAYNKSDD